MRYIFVLFSSLFLCSCHIYDWEVKSDFVKDTQISSERYFAIKTSSDEGFLICKIDSSERAKLLKSFEFYSVDSLDKCFGKYLCPRPRLTNLSGHYLYSFIKERWMYSYHIIGLAPTGDTLLYSKTYGD